MVSIASISVKDLPSFIDDFLKEQPNEAVVPISRPRARSHANNPHASPEDVGLFVAYENSLCVGYLGVLPGLLKRRGFLSKVFFSSTAYVPAHFRKTGAGLYLARALRDIDGDLVGCDNRPRAERLWRAFDRVEELPPYRIISIPISILRRSPTASVSTLNEVEWRRLTEIEVGKLDFWKQDSSVTEFHRNGETISWVLRHKWLADEGSPPSDERTYYFGHSDTQIEYLPIGIFSKKTGMYLGFQLFSVLSREGSQTKTMKILDSRLGKDLAPATIWALALRYATERQVSTIESSQETADSLDGPTLLFSLSGVRKRSYFLRPATPESPLAQAAGEIRLHYADGDTGFT